jgi:hypothetical protein
MWFADWPQPVMTKRDSDKAMQAAKGARIALRGKAFISTPFYLAQGIFTEGNSNVPNDVDESN